MEKLARPTLVVSRSWLDSSSSTIAVDDSENDVPEHDRPRKDFVAKASATPAITALVSSTCKPPRPSTSRRMADSLANDSSRPIRNRRKTTPSSAMPATFCPLGDGDPERPGHRAGERTEPERAQNGAGAQIAEDRTDPQPQYQWNHNPGSSEHDEGIAIGGHMVLLDTQILQFHRPMLGCLVPDSTPVLTRTPTASGQISCDRAIWIEIARTTWRTDGNFGAPRSLRDSRPCVPTAGGLPERTTMKLFQCQNCGQAAALREHALRALRPVARLFAEARNDFRA